MKWVKVGKSTIPTRSSRSTRRTGAASQTGEALQVFTGEYRHTVDDKGRIAVPARFRAQLAEGAFVSRWLDQCLAIHTRGGWDALAERVASLPVTDQGARVFQRFIFGGAVEAELDRQGRVLLPAFLRDAAELGSEAVVIGSRDHIEIWAPARWDDYRRALDDPQALAEAIEGLGI